MTLATREDIQQQDHEEHQQALATRRVELGRPIGDSGALKSLLEAQKKGIAQSLPRHITPERLIKTMLVATNRNPAILRCSQGSILETIMRAAELGLDLSGTLGEAYPVPYGDQLTLIIGYRGLEKLAWQTGEVESIDAEVVCQNDDFKFKKGTEVTVEWSPKLDGDRGPAIGAYACVKLKNGGKLARFLAKSDIEKIRSSSKSGNSPAWKNWWDEMARKCALKRTLKDAPLSTEKFMKAMDHDSEDFELAANVVEAETRPRGTAALVDKLRGRQLADPVTGEEIPPAPQSEEEASRIIESKSSTSTPAPAGTSKGEESVNTPPTGDDDSHEQQQTDENQASEADAKTRAEEFQLWKDSLFGILKQHGLKPAQATALYLGALVGLGKKGKETDLTPAECQKLIEQADQRVGPFAKKD